MARTIEEVEKASHIDLKAEADFDAVLNRAIQTSATQHKNLGPSDRLGWLRKALTELELSTESLCAAQKAADVAANMRRRVHERQVEAGVAARTPLRSWLVTRMVRWMRRWQLGRLKRLGWTRLRVTTSRRHRPLTWQRRRVRIRACSAG
jgi:hypothetical protein